MLIDTNLFAADTPAAPDPGFLMGSAVGSLSQNERLARVMDMVTPGNGGLWSSNGDWSMHELLLACLTKTGPAELTIASYAFSETAARTLAQLKADGMATRIDLVIDNRVEVRSAGSLQLLEGCCDRLVRCASHAKATVIRGADISVAIIGSANYTENARFEMGYITCEKRFEREEYHHASAWIRRCILDTMTHHAAGTH